MPKSGTDRAITTQEKNQPMIVYLRMKAALRNKLWEISKIESIKATKDDAIASIISSYNLLGGDNSNAHQAWRELYYIFFNNLQKVAKIRSINIVNNLPNCTIVCLRFGTWQPVTEIEDDFPFVILVYTTDTPYTPTVVCTRNSDAQLMVQCWILPLAENSSGYVFMTQHNDCTWRLG
jgi:hypothetical protein